MTSVTGSKEINLMQKVMWIFITIKISSQIGASKLKNFFSDENNTKNYLLLTQVPESKLLNYQTQLSISYDIHQTWLHPPQLVQSYRTRRILF